MRKKISNCCQGCTWTYVRRWFFGGSDSVDSAQTLDTDLQNLFKSGGFHLRKWVSSCPDAIAHLPDSLKAQKSSHSFNPDSSQRILGLEWTPETTRSVEVAHCLRWSSSIRNSIKLEHFYSEIEAKQWPFLGTSRSPVLKVFKLIDFVTHARKHMLR